MKVYYLYRVPKESFGMEFVAELKFKEEPSEKELRQTVAQKYPKLKRWEALRKKYVADRQTGRLGLPKKER